MNNLSKENSPYLLQHKDNPVDWYPWGEEALNKAKAENKPIFLSIGYAACHWCHVMAHESFEDPEIAKIMNNHFINIKVDREERPDLDDIYMAAVTSMTGQGGWPMSVFLTPEGDPFYGGTYFPPVRRYQMPSFPEILQSVNNAWEKDRQELISSGKNLTSHIKTLYQKSSNSQFILKEEDLFSALKQIVDSYDWENGGWGKAPKFPQPMTLRFLLQLASIGIKEALEAATDALEKMAKGGMYDVLGGGFARYSVDNTWLVPHFEKMLYNNAQLARVYLHAYLLTKNTLFKRICEETLDFIIRELSHPDGGFYSSLDADSEGVEGKFYVWDFDEIQKLINNDLDQEIFFERYSVQPQGNFEGKIILRERNEIDQISKNLSLSEKEVFQSLEKSKRKLFEYRGKRIRPATDDKVLVSWNAWTSIAFSEAGRYLNRDDYSKIAEKNTRFIQNNMVDGENLFRSWRDGKNRNHAFLEDYASLVLTLISNYQTSQDPVWYADAQKWMEITISKFSDSDGTFFDNANDAESLVVRPSNKQDNATPSGNSLVTEALLLLNGYSGDGKYFDLAEKLLNRQKENFVAYPLGFGNWLSAAFLSVESIDEIAIVGGENSSDLQKFHDSIWEKYQPKVVVASRLSSDTQSFPPLLNLRDSISGKTTAYICKNFVCKLPISSLDDFQTALENL